MNIDTCGLLDPRMSSTPRTKAGRPESPSNQFFKSEKKKFINCLRKIRFLGNGMVACVWQKKKKNV